MTNISHNVDVNIPGGAIAFYTKCMHLPLDVLDRRIISLRNSRDAQKWGTTASETYSAMLAIAEDAKRRKLADA
jgi:hypothetical protein